MRGGEGAGASGGWQQLKETVVDQWRPILVCLGLVLAFNVTNYMLTGYMPTYLEKHLDVRNALIIIVLVMVVIALLVTLVGRWNDRCQRVRGAASGALFPRALEAQACALNGSVDAL